jgi:signal transduction histidine kinase
VNHRRSSDITSAVVVLALAAWISALWLVYAGPPSAPSIPLDGFVWAVPFVAFAAVGGLIIARKPGNLIGWLLVGISLLQGVGLLGLGVLRYVYASNPTIGAVGWLELIAESPSTIGYGLLAFVLLTFPDGRLLSRRWRWVGWGVILYIAASIADVVFSTQPPLPGGLPASPLANSRLAGLLDPLASNPVNGIVFLAAASSLPLRYRAGGTVLKQQIKWFGLGVAVLVVFSVVNGLGAAVIGNVARTSFLSVLGTVMQTIALMGVPTAIGIAILRHRLFDIDTIISRALAYGTLAVLATATYVVLVVGAGTLLGRSAGTNLVLSVVATALLAVAFQPLRERLHAVANRLVYGRRQAPSQSLASFARRLAGTYSVDEVLPRMAEVVGEGLRCRAAAVMLDGSRQRAAARWPSTSELPDDPANHVVEVRHQGERHGSLAVWTYPGEELSANEQRLLADVALQAGLLLHNAQLAAELERRLDELRASRLRLVSAQDSERRKLERDLHDGAQHDLVALRIKLGLAEGVARTSSSELAAVLSELREDTASALETIRRLSRGLYPPLLESQGLAAALAAHARRLPLPVEVDACDLRFDRGVETAIYFCCVEALQNVVKHAQASGARICIGAGGGQLRFEIGDDGRGFDGVAPRIGTGLQNIKDRIDALEGTVTIQSGSEGTCIQGRVPLEAHAGPNDSLHAR